MEERERAGHQQIQLKRILIFICFFLWATTPFIKSNFTFKKVKVWFWFRSVGLYCYNTFLFLSLKTSNQSNEKVKFIWFDLLFSFLFLCLWVGLPPSRLQRLLPPASLHSASGMVDYGFRPATHQLTLINSLIEDKLSYSFFL